ILLANYVSGIIEPIQSRTVMIRFSPLPKEAVFARLRYIAENEGVKVSDDALEAIYEFTQGDMRRAINALQIAATVSKAVTEEVVAKALGMVSPRLLRETLYEAVKGSFGKAATQIYGFVADGGVGELEIIKQIHREMLRLDVQEYVKPEIAYIIAEAHYAILRGAHGLTQIYGALAKVRRLLKSV
ncbi:TPA: Replication factor C small subunit, partial [Pyrobaculum aerophilum]|nr:Replication factor C small subunit [Pyrobaculum aerophilum]